jgi:hypothetical protein
MALNGSGAISLAGTTVGQSIACELGCSGTGQIDINRADVRTLAGVASGQISFSSFYGKSNAPPAPTTKAKHNYPFLSSIPATPKPQTAQTKSNTGQSASLTP